MDSVKDYGQSVKRGTKKEDFNPAQVIQGYLAQIKKNIYIQKPRYRTSEKRISCHFPRGNCNGHHSTSRQGNSNTKPRRKIDIEFTGTKFTGTKLTGTKMTLIFNVSVVQS